MIHCLQNRLVCVSIVDTYLADHVTRRTDEAFVMISA